MPSQYFACPVDTDADVQVLEGTIQRISYARRAFSIVAQGQLWHFEAGPTARLWFEDEPVIFRCFHPLDHVRVEFTPGSPCNQLRALFGWERFASLV
jgi:hypothetical protein